MDVRITKLLLAIILLFTATSAFAGTYYVSPIGTATWANCEHNGGTPGAKSGASACSLATANSNAVAGDIVYLRGVDGGYSITGNAISPVNSGTAGNIILFSGYPSETVNITGVAGITGAGAGGFYISGKSYIAVRQINFLEVRQGFYFIGGGHNEVGYCTFSFRNPWNDIYHTGTAKNGDSGACSEYADSNFVLCDTDGGLSTYYNKRIYNLDDKSTMYIPSYATDTTITAREGTVEVLSGGTNNVWHSGDRYQVTPIAQYNPAACEIKTASTHNWIHHNVMHGVGGYIRDASDGGVVFAIGADGGNADENNNNTVEYNHIYHGGHHVMGINQGHYNVIRGNYVHNEAWFEYQDSDGDWDECHSRGKCGYRVVTAGVDNEAYGGTGLWEGNTIGWGDAYGGHNLIDTESAGAGMKLATPNNIYRYNNHVGNATAGLWFGSSRGATTSNNKAYNNTFYHNGYRDNVTYPDLGIQDDYTSSLIFYTTGITGVVVKNNLFYDTRSLDEKYSESGSYFPAVVVGSETTRYNSNRPNNTIENNYLNTDSDYTASAVQVPELTNPFPSIPAYPANSAEIIAAWSTATYTVTSPDLSIASGSAALNGGIHLTTVHSNDASSGTSLVLSDNTYFQAGSDDCTTPAKTISHGSCLSSIAGDWILVGNTVATATATQIIDIPAYSATEGTVTISPAISRSDGDKVWLYKKSDGTQVLYGSAPDIGAHERSKQKFRGNVMIGGSADYD